MKIEGYLYTFLYSIIVIIFGNLYKILAAQNTEMDNYRYQRDYDNVLISRLFQFNFFNFYGPMLLVAFYRNNYQNLFIMMFTQMACKQTTYNIIEWLMPIIKTRTKLNKLKQNFQKVLNKYTQTAEAQPAKELSIYKPHQSLDSQGNQDLQIEESKLDTSLKNIKAIGGGNSMTHENQSQSGLLHDSPKL